jgi:hypothetical protein
VKLVLSKLNVPLANQVAMFRFIQTNRCCRSYANVKQPLKLAQLRQRVAVEHTLAHVGHWQGDTARYRGLRKNLFDLRRIAVVHNLHVIARIPALSVAGCLIK